MNGPFQVCHGAPVAAGMEGRDEGAPGLDNAGRRPGQDVRGQAEGVVAAPLEVFAVFCAGGPVQQSSPVHCRDRASRTLTYNDEQFHILEKIKMQETIRVLVDLLQKECAPVVAQGRLLPSSILDLSALKNCF